LIDWTLGSALFFAAAGMAAIALMPREKEKKPKTREDLYKGMDDYALLLIFLSQRKFNEMLKVLRRVRKSKAYAGEKHLLDRIEALVKQHA